MRHLCAGLIVGLRLLVPTARGADAVHPGPEQDERQCENAAMPIADCMQQLMIQRGLATGEGLATAQGLSAMITTDALLSPYFQWLTTYTHHMPRNGPGRQRMLKVVHERTSRLFEDLLYRESEHTANMLTSLVQEMKQDKQQVAQLQQALADRQQQEKDEQERLKLEWFKALSCNPSMAPPNVTCTSRQLADGSTTTTCN